MHTMNPAMAGAAPYQVPRNEKRWSALTLAVLMHAGLLLFLWIGVQWQSTAPLQVEAEVWDIKVQSAAAPPEPAPEPEPLPATPQVAEPPPEPVVAPKAPEIALERAKLKEAKQKQLEEQQRKAKEKKLADEKLAREKAEQKKMADKKLANSKQALAEQKALEKARETEMRRITGAVGSGGQAQQSTAPRNDPGYVASLTNKIKRNIVYTGSTDVAGDPRAIYRIEQLPTGDIISVKKIKSSGVPDYDRAVENAINASSPLPKKKDGTVERTIEPEFRLKDLP